MKLKSMMTAGLVATMASGMAMAEEHVIKMKNSGDDGPMVFEPGYLEAEKGDTVKFEMTDPAHNSVSEVVPEGAESWSSDVNEEVTITLDEEGVYVYKCTPHAPLNMAGIIVVGEPTNYDEAEEGVKKLTEAASTNKDRLTDYFSQVEQ